MKQFYQCTQEDMNDIINIANDAFAPEREFGFDFRKIMPKVYNHKEMAETHYAIKDNDKIVSLVGRLIQPITLNGKQYSFSFLGTVSTPVEHRNQGLMHELITQIESDSKSRGITFGMLTGARRRYAEFGYAKCYTAYNFTFEEYTLRCFKGSSNISILECTPKDTDLLLELYKKSELLQIRTLANLFECLQTSNSSVFLIKNGPHPIGYFSYSSRKDLITELVVTDYEALPQILCAILEGLKIPMLKVLTSTTQKTLVKHLKTFSEGSALIDDLQIKVYDVARFLEFLFELNFERLQGVECKESYTIDDTTYLISIANNNYKITINQHPSDNRYSLEQFTRNILGDANNELCATSRIFPLNFGLTIPDTF